MTHRLSPPQERVLFSIFHDHSVDSSDYRMFRVLVRAGYLRANREGEWQLTLRGRVYCREFELEVEP